MQSDEHIIDAIFSKDMIRSLRLPLLLSILLFVGCGSDADSDAGSSDNAANAAGDGRPVNGGLYRTNVLRGDPTGLDPVIVDSKHASDMVTQIYDKLVDLDDDTLRLVPAIAKSWEPSEDGRSYTFHLRTDVDFQDHEVFAEGKGRRMTAEDVRYSFTRICDKRSQTKSFWAFEGKVVGADAYYAASGTDSPLDEVSGFVVVNDSTFRIDLVEPFAPFIFRLVNSFCSIVPHEGVEAYGQEFRRNPVGTGPFRFVEWKEGQEVLLVRNDNYWDIDEYGNRMPYLDSIIFSFIKDDNTQFNEFNAGNLDELFNLPTAQFEVVVDPETMELNEAYSQYQFETVPAMLTWYFAFNNLKPPFDDANVRRAFNYAIDRASIVRFTLKNSPYAPANHGLSPPIFLDYPIEKIEGYSYDQEKARELLAAAGFPEGKGFPSVTLHIYDEPRLREVAEAVQAQLTQTLSIPVEVKQTTFPVLIETAESGGIEFWGTRWYGDYPDPETYLNLLNGLSVPDDPNEPSNPNSSRYNDPIYNNLLADAVGTLDHLARMGLYLKAEQHAIDDAPVMPLFYERHYRLMQPWVRGLTLDPMAQYRLKRVWFDGPAA